ncbi:MAG: T9SS type A sorting domain-containing protein [Flavobacteriales bacterium]|nr:T9SS type A sorting domain-containing protein [Flavobacteriales bacterium]
MRKLYSVLFSFIFITSAFAQVPTSGLVGQWTFTNGSLYDFYTSTSAVAQPGAVTTTDRFGNAGNAYDLPTAAYLTFGDVFDVETGGTNDFAFSFWVKFDQINSTYRYMLGKAAFESTCGLAGREYAFLINASNQVEAQLFGALTGGHVRYRTNGTVSANAWTHIVYSVNVGQLISNNLSGMKIYINGVLQTTSISETVSTGIGNGMDNGTAHLSAARYAGASGAQCGTTQYLDGKFDDLRVYNRVLSAQEVLDLYNEEICDQAVITTQPPAAVAFCSGGSADISIDVADTDATLVWQVNTGNGWGYLTNQTGSTITVTTAGTYRVETQSACGAYGYSEETEVAVDAPAFVSQNASPSYICPSVGHVELNAFAVGEGMTYQWYRNMAGQPYGNQNSIVGATNETYQAAIPDVYYTVIVTACGNSITSNYIQVANGSDNSITIGGFSPGLGTICAGQSVTIVTQVAQSSSFVWSPANGTGNGQYLVSPTETTTYTVTATSNTFGCSATTTATVTVVDPQPEIVENMGTLEITGGTFNGFQWYLDGNIIQGAVSATYTPTVDGDYTVYVVEGSCSNTSDPFAYTGVATGIANATTNGLSIYPNPFNSEFVIETIQPTQIRVMNALGEVVLSRTINGRTSIDASSLSSGIYFVQEETSGAVMKLVKN